MNTRICAATLLLLLPPGIALAQQQPSEPQRKVMESMQPGAEHRELAQLEGRWNQEVTFNTGKTPLKAHGTATNRMILGGRFLVSERSAKTPTGAAMPIDLESVSIYGFDRRTKEYTIIELDSLGTYWVTAAGLPREDKAIVMSGETLDDHSGHREMRKYDMVLRVVDRDTYITQIVFKFADRPAVALVETVHRRIK